MAHAENWGSRVSRSRIAVSLGVALIVVALVAGLTGFLYDIPALAVILVLAVCLAVFVYVVATLVREREKRRVG